MTIHVPLKEAKNRLSELGRMAARGERIIVTNRGEPQFEINQIASAKKGLDFKALEKWKSEHGYERVVGPPVGEFDDPLPEDVLINPLR